MVRVVVVLVLVALLPSAAHAEKRLALLIGNQGYSSEIGRLANPHNDIALIERALKGLGFEVATVRDAGLAALHLAVNAYARRVRAAGPNAVGFFYYSGHGAADTGTNYLIPVDVKSAETGDLWDQSLRLTEITRKLKSEADNATHFVVFDACRNTLKLTKAGSRALVQSKGFVPVAQESGMLIAYATAEGELASDVGADAGPYANVLAEEIVKPGVESVAMFRVVQRRVRVTINQEPYLGFNALGDVYLGGLSPGSSKPAAAAQQPPASEAAEAWDRAKDATNIALLEAFVARYKDTFYADLARARIDELRKHLPEPPKQAAGQPTGQASTSSSSDFASFYIERCNAGHVGDCDIALNLKIDPAREAAVRAKRATLVSTNAPEPPKQAAGQPTGQASTSSSSDFASFYIERCNAGHVGDCDIALNLKIDPAREAAVRAKRSLLCSQQGKPHCP